MLNIISTLVLLIVFFGLFVLFSESEKLRKFNSNQNFKLNKFLLLFFYFIIGFSSFLLLLISLDLSLKSNLIKEEIKIESSFNLYMTERNDTIVSYTNYIKTKNGHLLYTETNNSIELEDGEKYIITYYKFSRIIKDVNLID